MATPTAPPPHPFSNQRPSSCPGPPPPTAVGPVRRRESGRGVPESWGAGTAEGRCSPGRWWPSGRGPSPRHAGAGVSLGLASEGSALSRPWHHRLPVLPESSFRFYLPSEESTIRKALGLTSCKSYWHSCHSDPPNVNWHFPANQRPLTREKCLTGLIQLLGPQTPKESLVIVPGFLSPPMQGLGNQVLRPSAARIQPMGESC